MTSENPRARVAWSHQRSGPTCARTQSRPFYEAGSCQGDSGCDRFTLLFEFPQWPRGWL